MKKLSSAGSARADMAPGKATSGESEVDKDLIRRLLAIFCCFEMPATPDGHWSRTPYPRHFTPLCVQILQPREAVNIQALMDSIV